MTGTLIVLNKASEVIMDSSTNGIPLSSSDGYRTLVKWATRLTNTGIYVHAAPWSVGSQGSANVSHGCVNVSDEWGKWFYEFSLPGDVVKVVNGPRPPSASDAGSRDWNMSWDEWVGGSANPGLTIS
jgi:lipoprotein-anchoring transpeptidase ErfK/SrfK